MPTKGRADRSEGAFESMDAVQSGLFTTKRTTDSLPFALSLSKGLPVAHVQNYFVLMCSRACMRR